MNPTLCSLLLSLCLLSPVASAAVIGTNTPPRPLTEERVQSLPPDLQPAWREYLAKSRHLKQEDMNALRKELESLGLKEPIPAPKGHNAGLSLNEAASWYGSAEGLRIATCIVSYQIPSGGWGKNLQISKAPRKPGQHFASDNRTQFTAGGDFDADPLDGWSYVGTFDNDATITQLRFLAKTIHAVGAEKAAPFRESFLKGLGYVFAAQYPNGGFPQVYPLMGGYHDHITINDGAMIAIIELLQDIASGADEYAWIPNELRARAKQSVDRAISCLLACQIRDKGQLTVWCQQHDEITLEPASARNYEMPSECAGESAEITLFLMRLPNPTPQEVAAVHAAAAWYERTALTGVTFKRNGGKARELVPTPGAAPLWARYYQLGTHRPIFGDRDKSIHDDVSEISEERRNGYSWFGTYGNRIQDHYRKWAKSH